MKKVFSVLVFLLVTFIFLVSAAEYSGDGIYTVQEGDMITIDNGWKVEILTILMAPGGEQLLFRAYDPEDNPYPAAPYENRLTKLEGREKYGNGMTLNL